MEVELNNGDIVYDSVSRETGLLLYRHDVLTNVERSDGFEVWAWVILWTGSNIKVKESILRKQTYTENGLLNMIQCGRIIHYKNN